MSLDRLIKLLCDEKEDFRLLDTRADWMRESLLWGINSQDEKASDRQRQSIRAEHLVPGCICVAGRLPEAVQRRA